MTKTVKYNVKRSYRNEKIPEMWFIDAIKRGYNTKNSIASALKISDTAAHYKLRRMLYDGKVKRDTSRTPFVYYLKEDEEQ